MPPRKGQMSPDEEERGDDGSLDPESVEATTNLLESIAADRGLLASVPTAERERLLIAAGQVSRPDKRARRALAKAKNTQHQREKKRANQALLDQTGIRRLRDNPIFETPRRKALFHQTEDEPSTAPLGEVDGDLVDWLF